MRNSTRERLAEIAAAGAVVAFLSAALCLAAFYLEKREASQFSRLMVPMIEKTLRLKPGSPTLQKRLPIRGGSLVRRAYRYEDKTGVTLGIGLSVRVDISNWDAEVLVLTDEDGRIRAFGARPGAPGLRAQDFETYVASKAKGSASGLGAAVDSKSLEYSVSSALEIASSFVRSQEGGLK